MSYLLLQNFFNAHPKAALGFSGGADSAFLLHAALRCGGDIKPYYVKTPFQPGFELRDAEHVCGELNATLEVIAADVLSEPAVASNPPDRCYHCKHLIFTTIRCRALSDGYEILLDGTNASDDAGDRPGMKALRELGVLSPLRECGLRKGEIRRLSKEAGLFTWDKPSYSCLATRIPTGMPVTEELLDRVAAAENFLFGLGFSGFRVRALPDGSARLQVAAEQMEKVFSEREKIKEALSTYFTAVTLDLSPRMGERT
ncbi:MAG: ATP-dependent sacrificial sulfur transferase LarE [Clostridiales bacterium]|jgi:uncharacterized protein|nr:ATP-dependent sacrificial sulfur transferase LarE [Clostridiales bacterium]